MLCSAQRGRGASAARPGPGPDPIPVANDQQACQPTASSSPTSFYAHHDGQEGRNQFVSACCYDAFVAFFLIARTRSHGRVVAGRLIIDRSIDRSGRMRLSLVIGRVAATRADVEVEVDHRGGLFLVDSMGGRKLRVSNQK